VPNSGNREDQEHRPQDEDEVYGITTAESSHMQEITRRQKQYILTMMIRVVSIIVVVLVPAITWPFKIALCVIAAIIPYIAVVRANGGPAPEKDPTNLLVGPPPRTQLGAAERGLPRPAPDSHEQADFIRADYFVKDEGTASTGAAARSGAGAGEPLSQGSTTARAAGRPHSGSEV
jgi:hypothetical protein